MIRKLVFRAAAGVYLAIGAWSSAHSAEMRPEDLYAAVLPSIVTLEVENETGRHFVGSGFLALGNQLAVTAWHVVHDARRVVARFSDGQKVKVIGLVDKDETLDLALLELESGARPKLLLGSGAPRIGSRVYVVGSPRGFDFSISEGLLSQIRTLDGVRYYQVSCAISPGDSGGPVLNEKGEAIGVISWRKADAENVSFAVPETDLMRMNPLRTPAAWPRINPPAFAERAEKPLVRADIGAANEPNRNDFAAFQTFLGRHAGQRLTITVQESEKQSRFTFDVPGEPANSGTRLDLTGHQ